MKLGTRVFLAMGGVVLALVVGLLFALQNRPDAETLAWIVLRAAAIALVAAGVFSWLLARSVTAPLDHLTAAGRAFVAGTAPLYPDSRIPEIAAPTLLLCGSRGPFADRQAGIQPLFRQAERVELASGPLIMQEQPAAVCRAVTGFLTDRAAD